jgi:predicted homoserine dehydrogenase-like protein
VFRDLRWGVYVVLEAPNDYAADCFRQYGLKTDSSGRYAAMYKPYHLIGLELNISILSAALRDEPTGQPHGFAATSPRLQSATCARAKCWTAKAAIRCGAN